MWELQIYAIEILAKISNFKIFFLIVFLLFITRNIKNFKSLNYLLIILYSVLFLFSFSFKEYGIDSIRLGILKLKLSPSAYTSYREDLEIMKNLRKKRFFSLYIYKNIDKLNKEFEYILNYLEENRNNKIKILGIRKEYIDIV